MMVVPLGIVLVTLATLRDVAPMDADAVKVTVIFGR
jgi:hypothetical protein